MTLVIDVIQLPRFQLFWTTEWLQFAIEIYVPDWK